jgi:hypothetical protein
LGWVRQIGKISSVYFNEHLTQRIGSRTWVNDFYLVCINAVNPIDSVAAIFAVYAVLTGLPL